MRPAGRALRCSISRTSPGPADNHEAADAGRGAADRGQLAGAQTLNDFAVETPDDSIENVPTRALLQGGGSGPIRGGTPGGTRLALTCALPLAARSAVMGIYP